jgi:hypothetical protein
MLVIPGDGSLQLIFQNDHANLSGRIARAWRSGYIAHEERRGEVLEAVGGHDSGWEEADLAGFLDESTGRPASFLELSHEAYPPLWTVSVERAVRKGPLAGYLVARHFTSLAHPRSPEEAGPEGVAALRSFRRQAEEAMERLSAAINKPQTGGPYPLAEEALDNDFRFLQLNDLLSLVVCGAHAEPELLGYLRASTLGGRPFEAELPEPFRLRLAPWVFGPGKVKDAVPLHTIPDRSYAGPKALSEAIASAQVKEQPILIEPL